MVILSNKEIFGKASRSLSGCGFRFAAHANILITLVIILLPSTVFAQQEVDRIDDRNHKNDYRSRKRRVRKEEEIYRQREATESLDSLKSSDQDQDEVGKRPGAGMSEADQDSDDMGPYGSQFKKHSFQDSDFAKHTFADLMMQNGPKAGDKDFSPAAQADLTTGGDKKKKNDYGDKDHVSFNADKEENDKHGDPKHDAGDDYDKHFDEISVLLKPPKDAGPKNWVPAEVDDTNNGGFGTIPDNGSPVPYRLNGHLDIERERPYRDADSD